MPESIENTNLPRRLNFSCLGRALPPMIALERASWAEEKPQILVVSVFYDVICRYKNAVTAESNRHSSSESTAQICDDSHSVPIESLLDPLHGVLFQIEGLDLISDSLGPGDELLSSVATTLCRIVRSGKQTVGLCATRAQSAARGRGNTEAGFRAARGLRFEIVAQRPVSAQTQGFYK
jgi:hypothetical protein